MLKMQSDVTATADKIRVSSWGLKWDYAPLLSCFYLGGQLFIISTLMQDGETTPTQALCKQTQTVSLKNRPGWLYKADGHTCCFTSIGQQSRIELDESVQKILKPRPITLFGAQTHLHFVWIILVLKYKPLYICPVSQSRITEVSWITRRAENRAVLGFVWCPVR